MNQAVFLRKFKPTQEFFIGIDSDGCVFDSMEIKHKECFAPMFIKHFSLQAVSKYAREVWEFVNLYSKTRGCNRFHAVIRALDLLRERKEVVARGVDAPSFPALLEWVNRESKLGNATLDAEVANGNDGLAPIKTWSDSVNASVKDIVHVNDLHATILHLMGIDHEKLTYRFQGRDFRLTDVHGKVIKPILS